MTMHKLRFLPKEITINILSRLPAKSIGRCRCVSKSWRSLLSNPHFIKTHLDHIRYPRNQHHSLIFFPTSGSLYSVPLTSNSGNKLSQVSEPLTKVSFPGYSNSWAYFHSSCDGLVFLEDCKRKFFLVDPVTRKIRYVPPSPFDPKMDFSRCGIGFDAVTDDYKIVTLAYHDSVIVEMFVSVFSVKYGTWKKKDGNSPYHHDVLPLGPGVFVDKYLHWISYEFTSKVYVIAAFDLGQENFHEVPLPSSFVNASLDNATLVDLRGRLCMSHDSFLTKSIHLSVWMMNEYGNQESWTKFIDVVLEEAYYRALCMLDQEQLVFVIDEDTENAKFSKCNVGNVIPRDIDIHASFDGFQVVIKSFAPRNGPHSCVGTFIESLASPHRRS